MVPQGVYIILLGGILLSTEGLLGDEGYFARKGGNTSEVSEAINGESHRKNQRQPSEAKENKRIHESERAVNSDSASDSRQIGSRPGD